ncbi:MAG TPA: hypothetical protein DDW90_09395 [Cyanobacteria bacterium UBA9971]|nr:hypothetical protein [Cyanobacteria bacterium UBA9971]
MCIENGKIFGKINIIDLLVVIFVLAGVLGLYLVKSGKFLTSSKVNQGTKALQFDVMMRGIKLSKDSNVLKEGEKSFITIRNVPYTKLEIVKVVKTFWQTPMPNPKDLTQSIAATDPTTPYTFNFLITLKDNAIITPEGPVIGGNKIKIGLPIELEGYNYKFGGIVSDVKVID